MIRMIDETSKKILTILQNEGRISFRQLAKQVNLSPSAVVERIHKLEDKGIIKGYKAEIDYEKMELVTRTIYEIGYNVANRKKRIVVDNPFSKW